MGADSVTACRGEMSDRVSHRKGAKMCMRMPLVVLIAAAAAMMIASTNTETPTSQESVIRWSGTVTVRFRETAVGSTFYRCGRPHGNRTIEYKTDNARWYEAVYKVVLRERESLLDLESGEVTWTFGEVWNEKGRCEGEDYVQARLGTSGVETMQPEQRVGHIWEDKVGEKTVQRYRVGIEVRKDMGGRVGGEVGQTLRQLARAGEDARQPSETASRGRGR